MEFGVPDPHFQGMGVWFGPNKIGHHTYRHPRINMGPRSLGDSAAFLGLGGVFIIFVSCWALGPAHIYRYGGR